MAYKVFTNGSVLNASEINENLMNQAIAVFSNASARTAAITSPVEGQVTYLEDTAAYESFDGSSWIGFGGGSGILQVVSTTKTDTFTSSSTSYVDVTGLSVTLTPSSASSKLLISWGINYAQTAHNNGVHILLTDGSNNPIVQGDANGSRTRTTEGTRLVAASTGGAMEIVMNAANSYLWSPATASAVTIKLRIKSPGNTSTVNRNGVFFDDAQNPLPVSSLTVMEVSG